MINPPLFTVKYFSSLPRIIIEETWREINNLFFKIRKSINKTLIYTIHFTDHETNRVPGHIYDEREK